VYCTLQEEGRDYTVSTGQTGLGRIRQDKGNRLECTGPREQTELCRTKMTDGISKDQDSRRDKTGPRRQTGLDKIKRTGRIRQNGQTRRD
jgi:hypothetical protein